MKDIYILGSGGFAKEVYFLINDINQDLEIPIYNFKGFIDKTIELKEIKIGEKSFPVNSEEDFLNSETSSSICLAIGIGNPSILEKIYNRFFGKYSFPNLIHPNFVGHIETIELGVGNIITAGCIFTVDVKIGSFNIFNLNTTVGHDTVIGSFNVINPGVNISGGVALGNKNLIGTNATILQYLTFGDNSILGAGAVLSKNLESNWVAVGIPAKPVKENF
jgi:sugar O-acyltransferase (sialic acid O-acetyltransferase NeuD family)